MLDRTIKILTNEDVQYIGDTVSAWKKGKNYKDIKGFCKSANLKDIEKNNFNLTPGRYVEMKDTIDKDQGSIENKLSELFDELKSLQSKGQNLDKSVNSILDKIND